jgi:hypothetical protein
VPPIVPLAAMKVSPPMPAASAQPTQMRPIQRCSAGQVLRTALTSWIAPSTSTMPPAAKCSPMPDVATGVCGSYSRGNTWFHVCMSPRTMANA